MFWQPTILSALYLTQVWFLNKSLVERHYGSEMSSCLVFRGFRDFGFAKSKSWDLFGPLISDGSPDKTSTSFFCLLISFNHRTQEFIIKSSDFSKELRNTFLKLCVYKVCDFVPLIRTYFMKFNFFSRLEVLFGIFFTRTLFGIPLFDS